MRYVKVIRPHQHDFGASPQVARCVILMPYERGASKGVESMSFWSDPGAWGPLSGWAGAIATGTAAGVAAKVYRRDSNLRRDAQAKKILARVPDVDDLNKFEIEITNYSHARIIEPRAEFEKLPWDYFKTKRFAYRGQPSVTRSEVEEAYRIWSKTPSDPIRYADPNVRAVDANATVKLRVGTRPNRFQSVSLVFQDSHGDWWRLRSLLAERGPTLTRVKGPADSRRQRFDRVKKMGKTEYDRATARQIDRWVEDLRPRIDAEDKATSREFRERVERERRDPLAEG
jgi:hypothetical protein